MRIYICYLYACSLSTFLMGLWIFDPIYPKQSLQFIHKLFHLASKLWMRLRLEKIKTQNILRTFYEMWHDCLFSAHTKASGYPCANTRWHFKRNPSALILFWGVRYFGYDHFIGSAYNTSPMQTNLKSRYAVINCSIDCNING